MWTERKEVNHHQESGSLITLVWMTGSLSFFLRKEARRGDWTELLSFRCPIIIIIGQLKKDQISCSLFLFLLPEWWILWSFSDSRHIHHYHKTVQSPNLDLSQLSCEVHSFSHRTRRGEEEENLWETKLHEEEIWSRAIFERWLSSHGMMHLTARLNPINRNRRGMRPLFSVEALISRVHKNSRREQEYGHSWRYDQSGFMCKIFPFWKESSPSLPWLNGVMSFHL